MLFSLIILFFLKTNENMNESNEKMNKNNESMKSSPDSSTAFDASSNSDTKSTVAAAAESSQLVEEFSITDIVISPEEPCFWSRTSLIQVGYGVWVNQTAIVIGLAFGFTSAAFPMLRKDKIFHVNLNQESWIAGAVTLCSPVGSLLGGFLMDKYGRKPLFSLSQGPVVLGWLCIVYSKNATCIIIGRIIISIGLGFILSAQRPYLTEISLPNMRGINGAMPNTFFSLGLLAMAGLAIFLDWQMLCYMSATYSIILFVSYIFIPETPHYLLLSSPEKARETLQKFRSKSYDVDAEMKTLLDFRDKNQIHSLSLRQMIAAILEPSVYKPFLISFMYITLQQLAGCNVVIVWNFDMLELSHTTMSADQGYVIICLTRFVFGILAGVIIYKAKRRMLALISAIGVGLSSLGICVYLHTHGGTHIAPLFFFITYIAFGCVGYYTLPNMVMSEILPLQHRGFLTGVNMSSMNFMIFGMNKTYPYMREAIGLANVMAIFGAFSLLGMIMLYFWLPETSELTLQEIEEYFNCRRPVLLTSRRLLAESSMASLGKKLKPRLKIN